MDGALRVSPSTVEVDRAEGDGQLSTELGSSEEHGWWGRLEARFG